MKRISWILALVLLVAVTGLYAQGREPTAKTRVINEKRIKELIGKLADQDPAVPPSAVEELKKIGKPAVGYLIEALKDKVQQVRECAAEALGGIDDKKAVKHLIPLLKDKGIMTRRSAVLALEGIGDNRAVEPLIEALKDKDEGVRILAGNALMEITGKDFGRDYKKWKEWLEKDLKKKVSGLIKKLGSEKFKEREAAQKELVKIGRPALLPLIDALSSEDIETKLRAGNILAQLEIELSNAEVSLIEKKAKEAKAENKEILQNLIGRWRGFVVNGLQATIKSDKKAYKLGGKITIEFRLENVSGKDIYIGKSTDHDPMGASLYWEILGPRIEDTEAKIGLGIDQEIPPLTKDSFVLIGPQKFYESKYVASKSTFTAPRDLHKPFPLTLRVWKLTRPGNYEIALIYNAVNDGKEFGLKAWTGKVSSNTITVEIKK